MTTSNALGALIPSTPEEAELLRNLADPMWRLCSGALYKIMVKSDDGAGSVIPFVPNRAQRRLIRRLWHRNIILKARQLGFCVSPETRVLTADLQWVPIGDIQPGTEVVACDENVPGGRGSARKMRTATVQAVKVMKAQRYRISFDDGRQVVCTDRHPWLSRKAGTDAKWRSISGTGNAVVGKLKVGTQVRWITKTWEAAEVEDGWFGGMLDGEGCISKANTSASINVSQRCGPVWDRLVKYADDRGYHAKIESDAADRPNKHGRVPVPKLAFGRMDEIFRLVGQTRPTRFLGVRFWEGREMPGKRNGDVGWATITSIEAIGDGDVVDMQTTTGTYIAEGFVSHNTTLVAIMWLDHALFNDDQRCGIIAQDREAAEVIFRDKVKLAYERLPDILRDAMPLATENKSELLFAHNNSSIRVATSMRSGTIHRLHVSEFGKIGAKFPDKAKEVVTGSLPAVPLDGIAIIESTAEGQDGEFYSMCQRAMATAEKGGELSQRDYRFHFFPWWQERAYRMDPAGVVITDKDREYFAEIEAAMGCTLDAKQCAWYVATRDADFSGDPEKMWQEYPSTPKEAFQQSTEGTYYAVQLTAARKENRVGRFPMVDGLPVNTFWDIGSSDGTAIWLHQRVGVENRFIKFIEGWGEPYSYFIKELQKMNCVWGTHYLPHDATHERQQGEVVQSPEMELKKFNLGGSWSIVPRVSDVTHGIQLVRSVFNQCTFDETGCKEGLAHLGNYRKEWNARLGCWSNHPRHDIHSEAADAIRQFAQGYKGKGDAPLPSWRDRLKKAGRKRTAMSA